MTGERSCIGRVFIRAHHEGWLSDSSAERCEQLGANDLLRSCGAVQQIDALRCFSKVPPDNGTQDGGKETPDRNPGRGMESVRCY